MGKRPKIPNLVLKQIREMERNETQGEFARALERKAEELGVKIYPTERSIGRLEQGSIPWPGPSYRIALTELLGRSMVQLGFTPPGGTPAARCGGRR